MPSGIDIQLYRRLTFGDLVDVYMLDTRQYRSDQNQVLRLDPTRTMLGDAQKQWLVANLKPPSLKAIFPWEGRADQYRDQAYHGGIFAIGFLLFTLMLKVAVPILLGEFRGDPDTRDTMRPRMAKP